MSRMNIDGDWRSSYAQRNFNSANPYGDYSGGKAAAGNMWKGFKSGKNWSAKKPYFDKLPPWNKSRLVAGWARKKDFPYKDYNFMPMKRGGALSLARYGATAFGATPEQEQNRINDDMVGRGAYVGNVSGYGSGGNRGSAFHGSGAYDGMRYRSRQSDPGLHGRGGFLDGLKKVFNIIKPALRVGATALGSELGGPMGGQMAGALFGGGAYGRGAYMDANADAIGYGNAVGNMGHLHGIDTPINQNSLINNGQPTRLIGTVDSDTNAIVVNHTEFITDILPTNLPGTSGPVTTGFQTQVFLAVNPGLPQSYPWLNNVAAFYEEYDLIQQIYTFKSMVTEGNATAGGNIIMAAQYNPGSPPFNSKTTMENYDYAKSCKVTEHLELGIECDHNKNAMGTMMYVRTGSVPANQDIKTYDLCTLQLATSNCLAGIALGELWVYYKIKLSKSKIPLAGAQSTPNVAAAVWQYNSTVTPGGEIPSGGLFRNQVKLSDNTGLFFLDSGDPDATALGIIFPSYITGGNWCVSFSFTDTLVNSIGDFGNITVANTSVGIVNSKVYNSTPPDAGSLTDPQTMVCTIYFSVNSPSNIQAILNLSIDALPIAPTWLVGPGRNVVQVSQIASGNIVFPNL